MSYKININKIDNSVKSKFQSVSIDNSDYRNLYVVGKNPINENHNKDLEIHVLISQKNLNDLNPILEWSYYTNPIKKDNLIKFRTKLDEIGDKLEEIVESKRLDESYLSKLGNAQSINESNNEEVSHRDGTINKLNQTYSLDYQRLRIDRKKLKSYLENSFGIIVDLEDIQLEGFDPNSGKKKHNDIFSQHKLGDEFHLNIKNITSKEYMGNITPDSWIKIKQKFSSMPFSEDIFINTNRYSISVIFSLKILVEIV